MSLFSGKRGETEDLGAPGKERPVVKAPPVSGSPTQPARGAAPRATSTGGETIVANIGKSISIKGDLTGNEDMVIEGTVEGKVDLPNNQLTIGENGAVTAQVNAKTVVVVGRVTGNVHGTERVEVQATGVVDGDVSAPKLVIAEGAVVNGTIQMNAKSGAASTPPSPSSAPASGEVRKAG